MFENSSEHDLRIVIRELYEEGDLNRKLALCDGSYIEEADVNQICFILGDFSEKPSIFRAIDFADKEKLIKAIQFCDEKGFLKDPSREI